MIFPLYYRHIIDSTCAFSRPHDLVWYFSKAWSIYNLLNLVFTYCKICQNGLLLKSIYRIYFIPIENQVILSIVLQRTSMQILIAPWVHLVFFLGQNKMQLIQVCHVHNVSIGQRPTLGNYISQLDGHHVNWIFSSNFLYGNKYLCQIAKLIKSIILTYFLEQKQRQFSAVYQFNFW